MNEFKLKKRDCGDNRKVFLLVLLIMFVTIGMAVGYSYVKKELGISGSIEINRITTLKKAIIEDNVTALDNTSSTYVSSSSGIDFSKISSDTNGKGLYQYYRTQSSTYPIYYYRGAVTNNNVIFADLCWKIVRTTEKGGVKLIYNGKPSNNSCNSTDSSAFSSTYNGAYNSSASYDYALKKGYVYYDFDSSKETASILKQNIDSWYNTNIESKGFTKYLEDSIWCNEISYKESEYTSSSNVYPPYYGYDVAYSRLVRSSYYSPLLLDSESCQNSSNRYTVNDSAGNRDLTFPIGLLTADEVIFAGGDRLNNLGNSSFYLYSGKSFWTMSSAYSYKQYGGSQKGYQTTSAYMIVVNGSGGLISYGLTSSAPVRPAISLKGDTVINRGDGSSINPYIVG